MASKTFRMKYADGREYEFVRMEAQGRKPRGMVKWNGYIAKADLDVLASAALPPYITVSSMIQIAVANYVRTELVNT